MRRRTTLMNNEYKTGYNAGVFASAEKMQRVKDQYNFEGANLIEAVREIKKLQNENQILKDKQIKIFNFCQTHSEFMWAAFIKGMIDDTDFKGQSLKEEIKERSDSTRYINTPSHNTQCVTIDVTVNGVGRNTDESAGCI